MLRVNTLKSVVNYVAKVKCVSHVSCVSHVGNMHRTIKPITSILAVKPMYYGTRFLSINSDKKVTDVTPNTPNVNNTTNTSHTLRTTMQRVKECVLDPDVVVFVTGVIYMLVVAWVLIVAMILFWVSIAYITDYLMNKFM